MTLRDTILDLLKRSPAPMQSRDIADILSLDSTTNIRRHLTELKAAGLAQTGKFGYWSAA